MRQSTRLLMQVLMLMGIGLFPASLLAQTVLLNENFAGTTDSIPPAGWLNVDSISPSAALIWTFDNPENRTINGANFGGSFAILDSDGYGSNAVNSSLITPTVDATGLSVVKVSFSEQFRSYSSSSGTLFASGDNGATWTSFLVRTGTSVGYPNPAVKTTVDISSVAANSSQVRVAFRYKGTWAYWWAIDNVQVFSPGAADVSPTALVNPPAPGAGCYGANQTVSVRVKNVGTQPINFSTNNLTVKVNVTGAATQTLTSVVNTGTLAVDSSQVFTVSSTFNMSGAGTYNFNASTALATGTTTSNDSLATVTRTNVAALPLIYTENFNGSTSFPAGWSNTSFSTISATHGKDGTNGLYKNLYGAATSVSVTLPKVGPVTAQSNFTLDYRYVNYGSYATAKTPFVLNAGDSLVLMASVDCGLSFNRVGAVTMANHVTSTAFAPKAFNLSTLVGQNVIFRVSAYYGGSGDYYLDLDNFFIGVPPTEDITPTALMAPGSAGCFGTTETVSVRVKNVATTAVDFSTNALTVNVNVSGAATQSFSTTVNTGTLASGAEQVVVVSSTFDMSALGSYTFSANTRLIGDSNQTNDTLANVTRINVAPLATPFADSLDAGTIFPAGYVLNRFSLNSSHGKSGTPGLTKNLYGTSATTTFASVTLPKLAPVTAQSKFAFDYRYVNYDNYATNPTGFVPNAGDMVAIFASGDCGLTFTQIGLINSANHAVSTSYAKRQFDLSAFAGNPVIIRIEATYGGSGDYYIDLDNFAVGTSALTAFSLTGPASPTTVHVNGASTTDFTATWGSAGAGAAYTFLLDTVNGNFTSPLFTSLSDNNGAATMLTLNYFQLDQFLASTGAQVGDTVNTDWSVVANSGVFTQYATDTFNLVLVRGTVIVANCPIVSQPTLTAVDACGTGNSATLSATAGLPGNYVVYLDSASNIIGSGSSFTTPVITGTTVFGAADANVTGAQQTVGPPVSLANTAGNFTNGMFFTAISDLHLDSIKLRADGALTGMIQVWDTVPAAGGKLLQTSPFTFTGVGQKQVEVDLTVAQGNYFINFTRTSGTGALFYAATGASYPYTIPGLISITGVNFSNAGFVFYLYDWKVTEACIGTVVSTTVDVQPASDVALPFFEGFEDGQIPCNWTVEAAAGSDGWLYGNATTLASSFFNIPSHGNFVATNDDKANQDKTMDYLITPMFDFSAINTTTQSIVLGYEAYFTGNYGSDGFVDITVDGGQTYVRVDTIIANTVWTAHTVNLDAFAGNDSVQIRFHHDDNGQFASGIAVDDVSLTTTCLAGNSEVTFDLRTDIFGSETTFSFTDVNTGFNYLSGGPLADVNPYDSALASYSYSFCAPDGAQINFTITDAYGDGNFDGTNSGTFNVSTICQPNVITGGGDYGFSFSSVFTNGAVVIDLGPDTIIIQPTDSLILDAGVGGVVFSTGDTAQTILVDGSALGLGIYQYSVSTIATGGCFATDTVFVKVTNTLAVTCPIVNQPNLSSADACGVNGSGTLSATPGSSFNYVVYLDSSGNVIGSGPSFTTAPITGPTVFQAADANVVGSQMHVGPVPTGTTGGFGNFLDGQLVTAISDVRIDSVLLRANGALTGDIQLWDNAPAAGGVVIQRAPFTISAAGDFQVPVGITVPAGNYFMNFTATSGTGQLYRTTGGATYPYTAPGVFSITGTTSTLGGGLRYYYLFDFVVTEACIGTPVATTVNVQPASAVTLPFFEGFENGQIPCNWTTEQAPGSDGWLYGNATTLSSAFLNFPGHGNFVASNDDKADQNKTMDYLNTPMLSFVGIDTTLNSIVLSFASYLVSDPVNNNIAEGTVDISTDGGATFTQNIFNIPINPISWTVNTLNLNAYAGMDSIVIRFQHDDQGTYGYGVGIDDVSVMLQSSILCNITTQPTLSGASVCIGTDATVTAVAGGTGNTPLILDGNGAVIGNTTALIDSVTVPVNITAVDAAPAGTRLKVGATTAIATGAFPTANFSNGLYFTVQREMFLDSVVLKHDGPVSGFITVYDTSVNATGVTAQLQQLVPFSVTGSGDTRVAVGLFFTPGSYFINLNPQAGTGILFRTTSGASFPYTVPGLVTITGTDNANPARYYYLFDWTVSNACIGTSVAFTVDTLSDAPVDIVQGDTVNITTITSVTLDAGRGDVVWSSGDSTQTIVVDGATLGVGTYTYTVSGQGGCGGTDTIVVVVSPSTSIERLVDLSASLSVYPNPSSGLFNIRLEGVKGQLEMEVYDLQGKKVYSESYGVKSNAIIEQFDISGLAKGVYILKLHNQEVMSVKRLIVQ